MTQAGTGSYADVHGMKLYYETHGAQHGGTPLVLLHGAFSATGTSFGTMLAGLSQGRKVISVEYQGHGHTADIDRPLSVGALASDVAALAEHLGIPQIDLFGYSMGAAVALEAALRYPQLVRKAVFASLAYQNAGMHPGLMEGMEGLQPEHLHGSPFHDEYLRTNPNPENFARLVEKIKAFDRDVPEWTDEQIRALEAPVLIILGDSDIVQPEHAVQMFRLLGGGVIGDTVGLPKSRLAILPGTTHVTVANRAEWIVPMVREFLES